MPALSQLGYSFVNYTTGVTIAWSTQVNSMPVTTFQVANGRPCMDPDAQVGNGFYALELMRYYTCPTEVNSGLTNDPRYVQQSSAAFQTNDYAVQ